MLSQTLVHNEDSLRTLSGDTNSQHYIINVTKSLNQDESFFLMYLRAGLMCPKQGFQVKQKNIHCYTHHHNHYHHQPPLTIVTNDATVTKTITVSSSLPLTPCCHGHHNNCQNVSSGVKEPLQDAPHQPRIFSKKHSGWTMLGDFVSSYLDQPMAVIFTYLVGVLGSRGLQSANPCHATQQVLNLHHLNQNHERKKSW